MKPDPTARPHLSCHLLRRSGCSSAEPYPPSRRRQSTVRPWPCKVGLPAKSHLDALNALNLGGLGAEPPSMGLVFNGGPRHAKKATSILTPIDRVLAGPGGPLRR